MTTGMDGAARATMDLMRAFARSARTSGKRDYSEFLASRIVQAGTAPTVPGFLERLNELLDCNVRYVSKDTSAKALKYAGSGEALGMVRWARSHPKLAAMILLLKEEPDYAESLGQIAISVGQEEFGSAPKRRPADVPVKIRCVSPLAHGDDSKAGNATTFRRCQVVNQRGGVLSIPFYAGNAIRGQIRDLLADHFLESLNLEPNRMNPPCALWFFHALYAGGALEESSVAGKALGARLGAHGAANANGITEFRDMLPALSVLGTALGNRILSGRVNVLDARPRCIEWASGPQRAAELMEWQFLTRREDHEGHGDDDHHGMIANTECLCTGTILDAGLDISKHATPLEVSALACGLELLRERGYLGAENRRGFGQVQIDLNHCFEAGAWIRVFDGEKYNRFLADEREQIVDYLVEIKALGPGCAAGEVGECTPPN